MNCMPAGESNFDPFGLRARLGQALHQPIDLTKTEPFEELLAKVWSENQCPGNELHPATPDASFAVWVAMALSMESSFWQTKEKDALPVHAQPRKSEGADYPELHQIHDSILTVLNGLGFAEPTRHAMEVTLVWLHGATRPDFNWDSSAWDGTPRRARFLIQQNIFATVEAVISWLSASKGPVGPRVPGGLPQVNLIAHTEKIHDYLVGWKGGACPCCKAAAEKTGREWENLELDDEIKEAANNESGRIRNCLRHHRLPSFLGQSPLLAGDDIRNLKPLADLLNKNEREFDKWLIKQLSRDSKSLISQFELTPSPKDLVKPIVNDINFLIERALIFNPNDEDRFTGIAVPSELIEKLRGTPIGAELRWLNRQLLELALTIPNPSQPEKPKNLIAKREWLSLGNWLQQAVKGKYGSVMATALTSGMLFPLLQQNYGLDYVNVAVRVCPCCESQRNEENAALPRQERRGKIYSYTLGQCCVCQHSFSALDPITLARFHIITTKPPAGLFVCKPSWTCPQCRSVYPAKRCNESRKDHKQHEEVHDHCPLCEKQAQNVRHSDGRLWNRGDVYWWF